MLSKYYYIISLEGIILNTRTIFHATAESIVLEKYGIKIAPETISANFTYTPEREIFQELINNGNPEFLDSIVEAKWKEMYPLLKKNGVGNGKIIKNNMSYFPDILYLLNMLSFGNNEVAVVSTSPMKWMKSSNIELYAKFLYSIEDCEHVDSHSVDCGILDSVVLLKKALAGFTENDTLGQQLIIVSNNRADVWVATDVAPKAKIFYVSSDGHTFKKHSQVQHFSNTTELALYIIGHCK